MHLPADMVVLSEEPDIMRAHWLAGALENAQIPVHVEEDGLADEFSVSQRVLGAPRVRVLVPADRLAEARTVFLTMSQPIPLVTEDEDDEYADVVDESSPYPILMSVAFGFIVLIAAAAVAAFLVGR